MSGAGVSRSWSLEGPIDLSTVSFLSLLSRCHRSLALRMSRRPLIRLQRRGQRNSRGRPGATYAKRSSVGSSTRKRNLTTQEATRRWLGNGHSSLDLHVQRRYKKSEQEKRKHANILLGCFGRIFPYMLLPGQFAVDDSRSLCGDLFAMARWKSWQRISCRVHPKSPAARCVPLPRRCPPPLLLQSPRWSLRRLLPSLRISADALNCGCIVPRVSPPVSPLARFRESRRRGRRNALTGRSSKAQAQKAKQVRARNGDRGDTGRPHDDAAETDADDPHPGDTPPLPCFSPDHRTRPVPRDALSITLR